MIIRITKNFSGYSILLSVIFIVYGCEKELICGNSKEKGIINQSVGFGAHCMNCIMDQELEFIIDSQEVLDSLYHVYECDSIEDPKINFSKYTLLGILPEVAVTFNVFATLRRIKRTKSIFIQSRSENADGVLCYLLV